MCFLKPYYALVFRVTVVAEIVTAKLISLL